MFDQLQRPTKHNILEKNKFPCMQMTLLQNFAENNDLLGVSSAFQTYCIFHGASICAARGNNINIYDNIYDKCDIL